MRPDDATAIIAALQQAKAPLIIAGGGVSRANAAESLAALAEKLGVPVVCSFRRNDTFPNDHSLYLGPLSFGAPPSVAERTRAADVILAVGTRLSEMTTLGYSLPTPDTTLLQIDIAPESLGQTYPASIAVVADAREAIETLLATPSQPATPERQLANAEDRARYVSGSTPPDASGVESLVDPARVMGELGRQLPPEAILTGDAGNFWGWVARYYQFRKPHTFLAPTSGAMGYAVPAAVAAALVTQNRVPVVAIAGDGGFLMTASELAVAGQHGLNVTCLVFDNAQYGTIRLHQERAYPGRVAGTELWSPDFTRYAEAFGGIGIRVERDADIPEALATAIAHPGIAIVSVAVARETIAVGTKLSEVSAR
jgi:acetolactate synthase-1/2/3 large subunit